MADSLTVILTCIPIIKYSCSQIQCYEGLDSSTALYEWNYPKQLLHIRLEERGEKKKDEIEEMIYQPEFLVERPLLEAIRKSDDKAPVLLIDEIYLNSGELLSGSSVAAVFGDTMLIGSVFDTRLLIA